MTLILDGAGTEWVPELRNPEHPLYKSFEDLERMGVARYICDACSLQFDVKKHLLDGWVPLVSEYEGHPSLVKWIKKGYYPIVI